MGISALLHNCLSSYMEKQEANPEHLSILVFKEPSTWPGQERRGNVSLSPRGYFAQRGAQSEISSQKRIITFFIMICDVHDTLLTAGFQVIWCVAKHTKALRNLYPRGTSAAIGQAGTSDTNLGEQSLRCLARFLSFYLRPLLICIRGAHTYTQLSNVTFPV